MNTLLENMLETNENLKKYLFIRGFMLTDNKNIEIGRFPLYENEFRKIELTDDFCAFVHKLQNVYTALIDGNLFFIFGHAYNPFTMQTDENEIIRYIGEAYGTEEYQNRIDEITGVFVLGCISGKTVSFQTDPSGMQSSYYGIIDGSFFITSHPQMIGDICKLQMSETAHEYTHYKWYNRVKGPYLLADLSAFDEIKRIVPNIDYSYKNGDVTHRRFYPLREISVCKTKAEYEKVIRDGADILHKNMILVSKKWNKPMISLTGGIDSNTTFAAANGVYDKFSTFSYISAEKEIRDADAASKISKHFGVKHTIFNIPQNPAELNDYEKYVQIIDHNNGYISKGCENEYRKRVYLLQNFDADVEVKSWVSETIRAYCFKHFGRKTMPDLSAKLFRNLYKIFIFNRKLAHKTDLLFEKYIDEFEYKSIPLCYPSVDVHYCEAMLGSWGGTNISEMKIYSDITIIYNNRKFLDMMFKVPLNDRINDSHHLEMKKVLNKELYDMNIRVVNMKETNTRAFLLNLIFTLNMILPY